MEKSLATTAVALTLVAACAPPPALTTTLVETKTNANTKTVVIAQERPDWIIERERMWERVEAACGDYNPPLDDLEDKLRACEATRALGRSPGEIRLGDTQGYVELQWGKPSRRERMVSEYGVTEWWTYYNHTVKFHNGVVEILHTR